MQGWEGLIWWRCRWGCCSGAGATLPARAAQPEERGFFFFSSSSWLLAEDACTKKNTHLQRLRLLQEGPPLLLLSCQLLLQGSALSVVSGAHLLQLLRPHHLQQEDQLRDAVVPQFAFRPRYTNLLFEAIQELSFLLHLRRKTTRVLLQHPRCRRRACIKLLW